VGIDGEYRKLVIDHFSSGRRPLDGVWRRCAYLCSHGACPEERRLVMRLSFGEPFMPTSHANVATAHASRYLQQLCKHWAHKFPVEFDPNHGMIDLSLGRTVMDADGAALHITVSTDEPASIERLESVVADHIKRFAFREELAFDWKRAEAA
jgi:uncharacterized protein